MKRKHFRQVYMIIDLKNHENSTLCYSKEEISTIIGVHKNTIKGTNNDYYGHFLIMEREV